jgi:hypothetical protein
MTAGMKRFVYSFLGALLVLAPAAGGGAQAGTTSTPTTSAIQSGLVVKKSGTQLKNEPLLYVTRADCVNNVEYEFTVRYTTNVKVAELWVGVGSQDCSSAAARQRASTGASEAVCKLVAVRKDSSNPITIKTTARRLFGTDDSDVDTDAGTSTDAGILGNDDAGDDAGVAEDGGADAGEVEVDTSTGLEPSGCDEVKGQTYRAFFIPLDQATDTAANMAYPPVTFGYSTLTTTFTLFTDLPDAPTNLSPKDGESLIGVKFSAISGALPRTKYRAYFDWGTGAEECGSGALAAETVSPATEDTIASVTSSSTTINLKDLDAKDIPIDSLVAVSVVTVDPAGNESLLSAPICVRREETIGFGDRCKMDPDCKLDSCALRPGARTGGALGGASLLALALALFMRRRHV